MKKVLILGIGAAQLDAIKYLKNAGWWVIASSYTSNGPGKDFVDQFELINITDVDALEKLVKKEHVDLVYSVGSDLAMPSIAEVASRTGLHSFISPDLAWLLQDKTRLRDFLTARGISPVKYRRVRIEADVEGWDIFPAMLKPADSQGQRGIYRTESLQEVMCRLPDALATSRSGTAILEELLNGPEVSANVFIIDGEVMINEISDRLVVEDAPGGIPRGHILPSMAPHVEILRAQDLVSSCVAALGIRNGPMYFQMKLTPSGPRIIEITPRLDGCHIWRLIREVHGIDLLDASFRLLSGEKPRHLRYIKQHETAGLFFFLQRPGEKFIKAKYPPPEGSHYTEYYLQDGQIVQAVNGHLEKVGYYIQKGA